jgi:acyl-CoA thioester hydrolase
MSDDIAPHHWPIRVYYEDTDAGGIVYYANYLKFFERARTEYLRSKGIEQSAVRDQHGVVFAVRSCAVEYLASARLDDALEVHTNIAHIGSSRIDLQQTIYKGHVLLTTATITVVAVNELGRATRIPETLRTIILPLIV